MNAILIEHVKVSELPDVWREKLAVAQDACVTVRIEEEPPAAEEASSAFGMWANRNDHADVAGYIRRLRASRLERE